jgi:hypothetical protein
VTTNYSLDNDFLFFSVETAGIKEFAETLEFTAPSNYKDPEKIQAYIDSKKAEAVEKGASDPDIGAIQAIAMKIGINRPVKAFLLGDEETPTEEDLLEKFWQGIKYTNGRCCGFKIIAIGIPFILRRSMALGVKSTVLPSIDKYQTGTTVDLYSVLNNWGLGKDLHWIANRYGISNELSKYNDTDWGKMDYETRKNYACRKVDVCVELLKKMIPVYLPHLEELLYAEEE